MWGACERSAVLLPAAGKRATSTFGLLMGDWEEKARVY